MFALLFVLMFQAFTRYAAAPVTGLVLDDWNNWHQARSLGSWREACTKSLSHPDRPVTFLALTLGYRALGDDPAALARLSFAGYSLVLALAFFMIFTLTRSIYQCALFGLIFSVLPNISEHFHWPSVAIGAGICALPLYLGSAWAWTGFVRQGRGGLLLLSVICYGIGLFGYEIGAVLPLSYAVLLVKRGWRRGFMALLPFGVVLGVYAAWRMSNAFGMGYSWYGSPPQMKINLSLANSFWSAREIAGWWMGEKVLSSFVGGMNGFALVGPWAQRGIVLGNVVLLSLASVFLCKLSRTTPSDSSETEPLPVTAFAFAWVASGYVPCLISYTASRLNYLPAVGVVFLLSLALVKLPISKWLAGLVVLAFFGMISAQGTARNWKESAALHQNLYERIAQDKEQWIDRKIVLFDTRQLADRLTPGITGSASHDTATVSHYRNAGLLRGFAPAAMVSQLAATNAAPLALLDVEFGARLTGRCLIWHDRYDPSKPHTNDLADVYVIDCLDALSRKAPPAVTGDSFLRQ